MVVQTRGKTQKEKKELTKADCDVAMDMDSNNLLPSAGASYAAASHKSKASSKKKTRKKKTNRPRGRRGKGKSKKGTRNVNADTSEKPESTHGSTTSPSNLGEDGSNADTDWNDNDCEQDNDTKLKLDFTNNCAKELGLSAAQSVSGVTSYREQQQRNEEQRQLLYGTTYTNNREENNAALAATISQLDETEPSSPVTTKENTTVRDPNNVVSPDFIKKTSMLPASHVSVNVEDPNLKLIDDGDKEAEDSGSKLQEPRARISDNNSHNEQKDETGIDDGNTSMVPKIQNPENNHNEEENEAGSNHTSMSNVLKNQNPENNIQDEVEPEEITNKPPSVSESHSHNKEENEAGNNHTSTSNVLKIQNLENNIQDEEEPEESTNKPPSVSECHSHNDNFPDEQGTENDTIEGQQPVASASDNITRSGEEQVVGNDHGSTSNIPEIQNSKNNSQDERGTEDEGSKSYEPTSAGASNNQSLTEEGNDESSTEKQLNNKDEYDGLHQDDSSTSSSGLLGRSKMAIAAVIEESIADDVSTELRHFGNNLELAQSNKKANPKEDNGTVMSPGTSIHAGNSKKKEINVPKKSNQMKGKSGRILPTKASKTSKAKPTISGRKRIGNQGAQPSRVTTPKNHANTSQKIPGKEPKTSKAKPTISGRKRTVNQGAQPSRVTTPKNQANTSQKIPGKEPKASKAKASMSDTKRTGNQGAQPSIVSKSNNRVKPRIKIPGKEPREPQLRISTPRGKPLSIATAGLFDSDREDVFDVPKKPIQYQKYKSRINEWKQVKDRLHYYLSTYPNYRFQQGFNVSNTSILTPDDFVKEFEKFDSNTSRIKKTYDAENLGGFLEYYINAADAYEKYELKKKTSNRGPPVLGTKKKFPTKDLSFEEIEGEIRYQLFNRGLDLDDHQKSILAMNGSYRKLDDDGDSRISQDFQHPICSFGCLEDAHRQLLNSEYKIHLRIDEDKKDENELSTWDQENYTIWFDINKYNKDYDEEKCNSFLTLKDYKRIHKDSSTYFDGFPTIKDLSHEKLVQYNKGRHTPRVYNVSLTPLFVGNKWITTELVDYYINYSLRGMPRVNPHAFAFPIYDCIAHMHNKLLATKYTEHDSLSLTKLVWKAVHPISYEKYMSRGENSTSKSKNLGNQTSPEDVKSWEFRPLSCAIVAMPILYQSHYATFYIINGHMTDSHWVLRNERKDGNEPTILLLDSLNAPEHTSASEPKHEMFKMVFFWYYFIAASIEAWCNLQNIGPDTIFNDDVHPDFETALYWLQKIKSSSEFPFKGSQKDDSESLLPLQNR